MRIKSLNESPSEKEGKCITHKTGTALMHCLNESPSEKEGKSAFLVPLRK